MIKIKKSKNGQYYFTVHAKNGAVLVTSEMYTRKFKCYFSADILMNTILALADSLDNNMADEVYIDETKPIKAKSEKAPEK